MDVQFERRYQIVTQTILVLVGSHFLYGGLSHSQSYGLTDVFVVTVAVVIPIAIALGLTVNRFLDAMLDRGELPDRKVIVKGPYYIHTWVGLIGLCALIMQIVFFYERFGSVEAWESWTLNPHQRTLASIAVTILVSGFGVLWIVVPGCELVWWVWRGKKLTP